MKLVSWNVNGLRAIMKKDFEQIFENFNTDILCLQEIKMQEGQLDYSPKGYHTYYHYAKRKGYSGTAIFTKIEPIDVTYGIGMDEIDDEGRVLTCEFDDFFLVNVYVPNSQEALKRIDYRVNFEQHFRNYLVTLNTIKPVIMCGDLNVAHEEIDIALPEENRETAGFSEAERHNFKLLLGEGFTDSFRYLYPEEKGIYSWWSYQTYARYRNEGWRIDYFIVSDDILDKVEDAEVLMKIKGSDHCPVVLYLNLDY